VMNRHGKRSRRRRRVVLPVWTYAQAQRAVPYLRSIMRSLREHRLEAQGHERTAQQWANRPGRPNRAALLAREDAVQEAARANTRFEEALHELEAIGIYCLDPIRGEALIPFVNEQQLAWYVFDLFDSQPLRFWRAHNDPLDTRRPLTGEEQ